MFPWPCWRTPIGWRVCRKWGITRRSSNRFVDGVWGAIWERNLPWKSWSWEYQLNCRNMSWWRYYSTVSVTSQMSKSFMTILLKICIAVEYCWCRWWQWCSELKQTKGYSLVHGLCIVYFPVVRMCQRISHKLRNCLRVGVLENTEV